MVYDSRSKSLKLYLKTYHKYNLYPIPVNFKKTGLTFVCSTPLGSERLTSTFSALVLCTLSKIFTGTKVIITFLTYYYLLMNVISKIIDIKFKFRV